MSQDLAVRPAFVDDFIILDTRSANGIATVAETPRVNYIATISGGYRNDKGFPSRTQKGEIYLHGDAPRLQQALEEREWKALTIAFPSDNPKEFIHQYFTEYTKTALKTFGDQNSVIEIINEDRIEHLAGTPEYAAAIARCKVSISVYFMLAEWVESGADMIFDDGLGLYRLRFTSLNSLHSILFSVQHMKKLTGGHIAGIPFELFMRPEEKSDGKGTKRNVWIWQALPKPPQGIRLTAQQFRAFADYGQAQIGMLQLEAPAPETIETAIEDAAIADLVEDDNSTQEAEIEDEAEVDARAFVAPTPEPEAAPKCDVNQWRKTYFAVAGKSTYGTDNGRKEFIGLYSGTTDSLSDFLANADEDQARSIIERLETVVEAELRGAAMLRYRNLAKQATDRGHVGGNGKPWPASLGKSHTREQIETFTATLQNELAQYPEDDPEEEENHDPHPDVAAEKPKAKPAPKTINQAVAEKRDEALVDSNPEETSRLFSGEDDGPEASDPSDTGIPKHIVDLMDQADNAGFEHKGDVTFGPLLAAINGTAKTFKLKDRLTSLVDLDELQAGLIETQLRIGRMAP